MYIPDLRVNKLWCNADFSSAPRNKFKCVDLKSAKIFGPKISTIQGFIMVVSALLLLTLQTVRVQNYTKWCSIITDTRWHTTQKQIWWVFFLNQGLILYIEYTYKGRNIHLEKSNQNLSLEYSWNNILRHWLSVLAV